MGRYRLWHEIWSAHAAIRTQVENARREQEWTSGPYSRAIAADVENIRKWEVIEARA